VKWLERIEVWDRPYDGFQQVETYRYRQSSDDTGDGVDELRVKSLMIPPGIPDWYTRERMVDAGKIEITGRAWSGAGTAITKVEFSDDGNSWREAGLTDTDEPYAWRKWSIDWIAKPGTHNLRCCATDANGATQPIESPWDVAGFGNNSVHTVGVTVR